MFDDSDELECPVCVEKSQGHRHRRCRKRRRR
jgi:hypothetical protein